VTDAIPVIAEVFAGFEARDFQENLHMVTVDGRMSSRSGDFAENPRMVIVKGRISRGAKD
jgi:hypothetical protein